MKIVYRVVAALAAVLTIPALWFLELFHISIEMPFGILDDAFSLNQIRDIIIDFGIDTGKDIQLSEELLAVLAPLKTPAIVTAVFLVLMLLMILAVFFCSVFTNARKVNLAFSLSGAVCTIGFMASFSKTTSLIIDGPAGLDKIINALIAGSDSAIVKILSFFVGGIGEAVDSIVKLLAFQLTDATTVTLLIFIFIALWTAAFIFIDMDENKMPKEKKQHHPKKKHN